MDQGLDVDQKILGRTDAALAAFNRLDTAKLIFESALQVSVTNPTIWNKGRKNQAMGASYAFSKAFYYFDALKQIERSRHEAERQIANLLESAEVERAMRTDAAKVAEMQVAAWFLAGRQEVAWHFFATCALKLALLLPMAARGAGTSMSTADKNFLRSYKDMRDHFEHLEERLPGKQKQDWLIREGDSFSSTIGFTSDGDGRVIVNGKPVAVTTRGFDKIEAIVQSTVVNIRRSCLKQLQQFFAANPDHIPQPEAIPDGFRTLVE